MNSNFFFKSQLMIYQFGTEWRSDFALHQIVPVESRVKFVIANFFQIGRTRSQPDMAVFLQQLI